MCLKHTRSPCLFVLIITLLCIVTLQVQVTLNIFDSTIEIGNKLKTSNPYGKLAKPAATVASTTMSDNIPERTAIRMFSALVPLGGIKN